MLDSEPEFSYKYPGLHVVFPRSRWYNKARSLDETLHQICSDETISRVGYEFRPGKVTLEMTKAAAKTARLRTVFLFRLASTIRAFSEAMHAP